MAKSLARTEARPAVAAQAGSSGRRLLDAPTGEILISGSDCRIDLVGRSGRNRYHTWPTPVAASEFGSSTSSTVSPRGFAAASNLQDRLRSRLAEESLNSAVRREVRRQRQELLSLCKLEHMPGLGVVFAASGTDIHLIAAQLCANASPDSVTAIVVEDAETGGGVPAALSGRHFSSRCAAGDPVVKGDPAPGAKMIDVLSIAARQADGSPRPLEAVGDELERTVDSLAAKGGVLITITDLSKTGMLPTDIGRVFDLQARWPGAVQVLVDACQFRLSSANLRAYLDNGCMVAVTGSKFLGGPSFSGALLVPQGLADLSQLPSAPPGLSGYCNSMDAPDPWTWAGQLPDRVNLGLLLRWEAALEELRAFSALPEWKVARFLQRFAGAVAHRLEADPALEALQTPRPDRGALGRPGWDGAQTIFPFLLRNPATGQYIGPGETAEIYRRLSTDAERPVILGQPVSCGARRGVALTALRLCVGSRLVVDAVTGGARREAEILTEAALALNAASTAVRKTAPPSGCRATPTLAIPN